MQGESMIQTEDHFSPISCSQYIAARSVWAAELTLTPALELTQEYNDNIVFEMQDLIVELKHCYPDRYVVFDLPPLFECADPLIFSDYVDGVLLVVEAHKTTTDHLKKAMGLLEGKNIIGTVLNKARRDEKQYYRYYY